MIYIIHSDATLPGTGQAVHYIGYSTVEKLASQIARYKAGKGAKILAARRAAGVGWQLVRVLTGDQVEVQKIVESNSASFFCPICQDTHAPHSRDFEDYFRRAEISNSDLMIYKHVLMGVPYVLSQTSISLGQAVHQRILEPHIFLPDAYVKVNMSLVEKLANRFLSNTDCQKLLLNAQIEQPVYTADRVTGIPIRCKADILSKDLLVDIKTTRARSENAFLRACGQYEYDRQMAFYLDAFGRSEALIIGISKTTDKLFFLLYRYDSDFISRGRKKYRYLLDKLASDQKGFDYIYAIRNAYADSLEFEESI